MHQPGGLLLVSSEGKPKAAGQPTSVSYPAALVDLEGFEPSSARLDHMLSTRLFQPLVFVYWQDLDHQPIPYPLRVSSSDRGLLKTISDLTAPLHQGVSEKEPLSDVSSHHLVTG